MGWDGSVRDLVESKDVRAACSPYLVVSQCDTCPFRDIKGADCNK